MKKIILAAFLLTALTTSAFADGKKSNAKLLSDLKTALQTTNVVWKTTAQYNKTSFSLNGKSVSAFVDPSTGELIGFTISVNETDLPEGTLANLAKKFEGWHIDNSIMFMKANGAGEYYTQVTKGKNSLALSVSSKGRLNIYARMPQ